MTPYSEDYKRRMNEYFSRREGRVNVSSDNSSQARISAQPVLFAGDLKHNPKQDNEKSEDRNKKLDAGILTGLIILFLVLSFSLLYTIPKNPTLWGIILAFCVMAVFFFLFIFHKTYEKIIQSISAEIVLKTTYLLLIINMILSGYSVYSVEWAFLVFLIAAVIFYDSKIDSRFLIFPALLLLGFIPFLLIGKQNDLAEKIAIYVYYFLVVGVGLQIVESIKKDKFFLEFSSYIRNIIHGKYLGESMIFLGCVSIILIIINKFSEIEIWKWASIYVFSVLLIFYLISLIGKKEEII